MKKDKLVYVAPEAEIFEVKLQEGILGVSGGANYAPTPGGAGGNDTYDDGDSF